MIRSERLRRFWRSPTWLELMATGVVCWALALVTYRSTAPTAAEVVLSGTTLTVRLAQPLSSHTARLGEVFDALVVSTTTFKGSAIIPAGTRVEARCVAARPEEDGGRPGYLRLTLSGLWDAHGRFYPLETTTLSQSGEESFEAGRGGLSPPATVRGGLPASSGSQQQAARVEWPPEAVISPEVDLTFVLLKPLAVSPGVWAL